MKNTVVYFHRRNDDNSIFYVGIGKNKKRPKSKDNRNTHWHNIVNKVGYTVEIVHEGLTWDEGCEYEVKYIKDFGRKDKGLGPLVNMTDGGDGTLGHNPWNKGKERREETKRKISISKKGKKMSKEFCERRREIMLGSKRPKHSISMTGVMEGEKHPMCILTKEDVLEIRRVYSNGGVSQNMLSKKYGVSRGTIYKILNRKTWKNI